MNGYAALTFRTRALYRAALLSGKLIGAVKGRLPEKPDPPAGPALPPGMTVVIPSRSGADLLARLLPGVERELTGITSEIIVVDNGSDDQTAAFLHQQFPSVVIDLSAMPLSFAAAVNRGIRRARYQHVCLLNNDMVVGEGFFSQLRQAFAEVPDLFCATAQILFPPGVRREETGKAVMPRGDGAADEDSFPVRCDTPVEGENLTYVLYGSGGASAYDLVKLRQLGAFGEMYRPAYVEDLDVGFRAWQRGWPTVYVARASVVHYHRTTTSRYYTPEALELVLDVNYLRFLVRAVTEPDVFRRLWERYLGTLARKAARQPEPASTALCFASRAARWLERPPPLAISEAEILAVGSGDVAVFPGLATRRGRPPAIVVLPAAIRLPESGVDRILVAYCDELAEPPHAVRSQCLEVVLVRRAAGELAFRGALRLAIAKYSPVRAQVEAKEMATFADVCRPLPTLLLDLSLEDQTIT